MTIEDLIAKLETYPQDTMIRHGKLNRGEWDLSNLCISTIFTDETGERDLTDRERDRDIECVVLF